MTVDWERPPSPREIKDRAARKKLGGAIALVVIVAASAGILHWIASRANPPLSQVDLCPVDRPISDEIIVIFDATSPWSPIQEAVIEREFRAFQSQLEAHDKVTLYSLNNVAGPLPEPALSLCHPGTIEDVEVPLLGPSGTVLVTNRDMIKERWEHGFISKLDSIFSLETESAGSDRSLILETIQSSAIQAWSAREQERTSHRSLLVFSDMLQNSELYSHYRDSHWTVEDGKHLADFGEAGTQALQGVEVMIFLLDRPTVGVAPGHMRSDLVGFWDSFFSEQGALLARVRRIEG